MPSRRTWLLIFALGQAACGGSGESADRASPAANEAGLAEQAFDRAAFDTITWASDSVSLARGGVVFTYSCQKCHGVRGRGDGGFVMEGDTLRPPSFVETDWRFGEDLEGLRRYIFVGNEQGMPHWGIVGLKARDIDAVARYIQTGLRR